MLKLIWNNFGISILAAFFGALLSLVVTGDHIGNAVFWFNTVLLWIIFMVVDLVKGKHKEAE